MCTPIRTVALAACLVACAHSPNAGSRINVPPADGSSGATLIAPTPVLGWSGGEVKRHASVVHPEAQLLLATVPPAGERRERGDLAEARPVLSRCLPISSFLPAPAGDRRLFLVIGQRLFVITDRDRPSAPVPIDGIASEVHIHRLLAFVRDHAPLQMLVSVWSRDATTLELWVMTVDGQRSSAWSLSRDPGFASQEEFFRRFEAPRCLDGGRRCLVVRTGADRDGLDVEPVRGDLREPLLAAGQTWLLDAAWADPRAGTVYLLAGCPEQAAQSSIGLASDTRHRQ